MRVRTLELRLIALVLAGCWVVAAVDVLIAYRPGGPIDVAVGLAALLPALVALAGVVWPPVDARRPRVRGDGLARRRLRCSLLVPSIADVSGQLGGRGAQTLLPSVEAALPVGPRPDRDVPVQRVRDRPAAARRGGDAPASRSSAGSSSRRSSRRRPGWSSPRSRWATSWRSAIGSRRRRGSARPTSTATRRSATAPMGIGPTARLERPSRRRRSTGGRSGTVDLAGDATGADVRWLAYVATTRELGLHGAATHRRRTRGSASRSRAGARATPRRGRRRDARPHGVPRRPLAGGAGGRRVARRGDHRGRARAPVPDRDRRPDVPGGVPAGRRGSSATPTSPTGAASSTTGSSSTARSAGSPAASTATRRTSSDGALQATIRVDLTATDRGARRSTRRR